MLTCFIYRACFVSKSNAELHYYVPSCNYSSKFFYFDTSSVYLFSTLECVFKYWMREYFEHINVIKYMASSISALNCINVTAALHVRMYIMCSIKYDLSAYMHILTY